MFVDKPIAAYLLVAVAVRSRFPVHARAGITFRGTRRFGVRRSVLRFSAMEITDTDSGWNDTPGPDNNGDITRFFGSCQSRRKAVSRKYLSVFIPAALRDSPFGLRTRPSNVVLSPCEVRSYSGHVLVFIYHRHQPLEIRSLLIETLCECAVTGLMGSATPPKRRGQSKEADEDEARDS